MHRTYRVILTVDIDIALEDDQYDEDSNPNEIWGQVEEELENITYWQVGYDAFGWASVEYADLDSFVE